MADQITGSLTTAALAAFQRDLTAYRNVSGKSAAQVLGQKGRDLSIKTGREFGTHAPLRGQIKREAAARHAAGKGTKVRASIAKAYSGPHAKTVRSRGRLLRGRAAAVARELSVRSSGAKVMAVSFYFRQWRARQQTSGSFSKKGRSGQQLGAADLSLGVRHSRVDILGQVEGEDVIDAERGVVAKAVNAVMSDIGIYMARKEGQAAAAYLKNRYR